MNLKKHPLKQQTLNLPQSVRKSPFLHSLLPILLAASLLLSSCGGRASAAGFPSLLKDPTPTPQLTSTWSGRPEYKPGELVDYIAQSGDTLPALAAHFNTTVNEIRAANPIIPLDATTMPPGMPMKIPIYYLPLWGDPYKSLPDHAFVYGPTLRGFNTAAFVESQPGWLKNEVEWAANENRNGAEIVDYVASNFSVSPRLLLALLEYQTGALSQTEKPKKKYLLGYEREFYTNVYLQLVGAANTLNNGYYRWRAGDLTELELLDGSITRPDPWQNAASVALQYYFSRILPADEFRHATGPNGLAATYTKLFGDPWQDTSTVIIPGSLTQPKFQLPFPTGFTWSYTGGPHTGWGSGDPFAAIDFAPPSQHSGCFLATDKDSALAVADGIVARSEYGLVMLDLDGDGDERTGWDILYLHVATRGRAPLGQVVQAGDHLGYPSCEGGTTTGTHIHIARKYNGEWILADGPLALNMEGWVAHNGVEAYKGTLTKGNLTVIASSASTAYSSINSNPDQ